MKNKYGLSVINLMRLSSRYRKKAMWGWAEGIVLGIIVGGLIAWVVR